MFIHLNTATFYKSYFICSSFHYKYNYWVCAEVGGWSGVLNPHLALFFFFPVMSKSIYNRFRIDPISDMSRWPPLRHVRNQESNARQVDWSRLLLKGIYPVEIYSMETCVRRGWGGGTHKVSWILSLDFYSWPVESLLLTKYVKLVNRVRYM